jgi:RimJ/RimL family protein N-acetyltransferase
LRGTTIILRQWDVEDAAWYVAARDGEIFRWTAESTDLTVESVRDVIRKHRLQPRWVGLAIADATSGALLGNIALHPTGERAGEAEVSYWLAPAGRGRGAATEALATLVEWAFASKACNRVILHTCPGNERSQAVARRTGFVPEREDAGHLWFSLDQPSPGNVDRRHGSLAG